MTLFHDAKLALPKSVHFEALEKSALQVGSFVQINDKPMGVVVGNDENGTLVNSGGDLIRIPHGSDLSPVTNLNVSNGSDENAPSEIAWGAGNPSESVVKVDQDWLVQNVPGDELLGALLRRIDRWGTEEQIEKIKDLIYDNTQANWEQAPDQSTLKPNDTPADQVNWSFLDGIEVFLTSIPGVTKVQRIIANYPEIISLMISYDFTDLSDEEIAEATERVSGTILQNKPKGLEKFEVIHNVKEVL